MEKVIAKFNDIEIQKQKFRQHKKIKCFIGYEDF